MESVNDLFNIQELDVRCAGIQQMRGHTEDCKHLLMKLKIFSSLSDELKLKMKDLNLPLSAIIKGFEFKIGIQIKCRKCKTMEHSIIVV